MATNWMRWINLICLVLVLREGQAAAPTVVHGTFNSFALTADGTLCAWGYNGQGQLGDGTTTDRYRPVKIGDGYIAVASGGTLKTFVWYGHTVAIKRDGTLWAWGYNGKGQLGDGTTTSRSVPMQIGKEFSAVAASDFHTLALKTDGSLWAWGENSYVYGPLGDPAKTASSIPVQLGGGYATVSTSGDSTFAVRADGTLWAWGYNRYGDLGDGTTINRNLPVQIGSGFSAVDGSAAIKSDGTLWAWGYNYYGEVGDGTTINRNSPVSIGSGFSSVHAGLATYAIKNDGTLWAWGYNLYGGYLGDGTTQNRASPVQIGSGYSAVAGQAAGAGGSLAVKSDGSVWTWGDNSHGQLGDGTLTARRLPAPIDLTTCTSSELGMDATVTGSIDNLTVGINYSVAPSLAGQNGNLFLAALIGGTSWYAFDGNTWVRWAEGPLPAAYTGPLSNRSITALQDVNLTGLGLQGALIYAAYGQDQQDMLTNQRYKQVFGIVPLQVTKSPGDGGGVTSSPAGIYCGQSCTAAFTTGTIISLTASPVSGGTFLGWGGDCSGTGICTLNIDGAKNVIASFTSVTPTPLPTPTPTPTPPCTYWISPTSQTFDAAGDYGTVNVRQNEISCLSPSPPWSATTSTSWITRVWIGSLSINEGPAYYYVEPNPTTSTRTGTVTVAGNTHTVTQSGGAANPFQGQFPGGWSGSCPGYGPVNGTFTMNIAANGSVSGSYSGSGESGNISGSVSAGGTLSAQGTGSGGISWRGTFTGISTSRRGSGTWTLDSGCSGSWSTQ